MRLIKQAEDELNSRLHALLKNYVGEKVNAVTRYRLRHSIRLILLEMVRDRIIDPIPDEDLCDFAQRLFNEWREGRGWYGSEKDS